MVVDPVDLKKIKALQRFLMDPTTSQELRNTYRSNLKVFYSRIIDDNVKIYDYKSLMYICYFMEQLEKAFKVLNDETDLESMFKKSEKIEVIVKK